MKENTCVGADSLLHHFWCRLQPQVGAIDTLHRAHDRIFGVCGAAVLKKEVKEIDIFGISELLLALVMFPSFPSITLKTVFNEKYVNVRPLRVSE